MNAEILCVGTEILLGDIINTNAAYIARGLAACGIGCYYQTVVGDNPERLRRCLTIALGRAEIVIMTGGLGPTYDDLTKETVAEYFGLEMVLHQPSLDMLTAIFQSSGRPMTENNRKQAMMPAGAIVFPNDRGTANGLMVQGGGKTAILLPGPPREMTAMFDAQVKPYLQGVSGAVLVSRNVHLFGIGESSVEHRLRAYMESHTNPTIAPYAKEGEVLLRVTARAESSAAAEALIAPVLADLQEELGDYLYGIDVGDLQTALVESLRQQGMTIAVAESCTGGLVGKRITEVPGASAVFGCGVCTYSNEMKRQILHVKPETLESHGAVSAETAIEMARGVRLVSGADIGVSITGIAGPDGGTPEKPVGLVYIGLSTAAHDQAKELHLSRNYGGGREYIRWLASSHALSAALCAATPRSS